MIFLRSILITLALLSFAVLAMGQTSKTLRVKFGKPSKTDAGVEMYDISPRIQMTVKYASNGEACEVEIRQNGLFGIDRVDMNRRIDRIVSDIVPLSKRGKRIPNHYGRAENCITSHNDEYESVLITYFEQPCGDSYQLITVRWKKRTCISTPPLQPKK